MEAACKPVVASKELKGDWSVSGHNVELTSAEPAVFSVNFDTGTNRATGPDDDPDYAIYGRANAILSLPGADLGRFNRLAFVIEPDCPGLRIVNLTFSFKNQSAPLPSFKRPTGAHLIHLKNGQANKCFLEIDDFQRDCITDLIFTVSINGRDLPSASRVSFKIYSVSAEKVADIEKVSGWEAAPGRIIYSHTGYCATGPKIAICPPQYVGQKFKITTRGGKTAFTGRVANVDSRTGSFGILDFSKISAPGEYNIVIDSITTPSFAIDGRNLWDKSCWRVLNFIFCQRCGYAVPGVHSKCHTDLFCCHEGMKHPYSGGWHDAGDLSQQTLQSADIVFNLLELYQSRKNTDCLLAARLREEALWGLDFVIRSRLGKGYHASSMGLLIWQDGIVGTIDDIHSVRVQNLPYDNFLYAAYEAYAARVLDDGTDPALIDYLKRLAAEDYDFALQGLAGYGFGGWITPYEHTFNTAQSLFMATASWAASQLYALTAADRYAADAAGYADDMLACQCTAPVGGLKGFFYREPEKHTILHYTHQCREQIFMLALRDLCLTQAQSPELARWQSAMADYGAYIKSLMEYSAPYGMIPAGIYHADEYLDAETFAALHPFSEGDVPAHFAAMAAAGVPLADNYFIRRFPMCFDIYDGNLAIHASMGKAAAICANTLNDDELRDIAREQLYWIVGKNPFCQSLIYGEGTRYPELNNFSSGPIIGAIPVGIRSLDDTDEPYWPQINNACYKEVWLTSAGKWLSLVAETDT